MAYCVLRGMDIGRVDFSYELKNTVSLVVILMEPVTGQEHSFSSSLVWDVELLRHMGIMALSGKPVLHGFYAFAS